MVVSGAAVLVFPFGGTRVLDIVNASVYFSLRTHRQPKENTMYAPTEDLTRIANNSRDAVAAALNAWAEAAQRYAADFDAKHPVPDAAETQAAIDTAYDLAGKLLAEQRAYATSVIAASKEATEAATERFRTLAPSFPVPAAV